MTTMFLRSREPKNHGSGSEHAEPTTLITWISETKDIANGGAHQ
jgi:hypothetical protein